MKAIVIATKGSRSLNVLLASINAYVPEDVVIYLAGNERWGIGRHITCIPNTATNYGDAYNAIVHKAFEKYDEIIVANDDIVLTPTSYDRLMHDIETAKYMSPKVGWVASTADYVRPVQQATVFAPKVVFQHKRVSPLFAYISKEAWVDYPPINWYSDDIQCMDIEAKGYRNYVGVSYVHHAGSQTIGENHAHNHWAAEPWIKENRPELHKEWYVTPITA